MNSQRRGFSFSQSLRRAISVADPLGEGNVSTYTETVALWGPNFIKRVTF